MKKNLAKQKTNMQWGDILSIYSAKIEQKQDVTPNDYERIALAYTATGNFEKALESLDFAINNFPNYEKRGDLIYRSGFIAWSYMSNGTKAKEYYEQFLSLYPTDEKAAEVKTILSDNMLERSDEENLEMIKKKAALKATN